MTELLHGAAAARVFACFAAAYLLSYALRAINAVIAPQLVAEFGLDSAQLGLLTSAYLIAFAAMQLPLGWCLDRYGPRRTEAALLLVAAVGSVLYAVATGVTMLWVGRALIGMGVSACLMGAFKGFRFWYAPSRQGQLGAWMLVVGTLGVLVTTVPVQALVPVIGWRGVFWLIAAALAAASAAIYFGLPRRDRDTAPHAEQPLPTEPAAATAQPPSADSAMPTAQPPSAEPVATRARVTSAHSDGGYRAIARDPFFWRMALIGVFHQGGFIALQTLWAGPWFTEVLGATPQQASYWLLGFNAALLCGYLVLGWITPFFQRRGWAPPAVASVANCAGLVVLAAIVFAGPHGSAWWWAGVAVTTTTNLLLQTHVNMSYAPSIAGRVSTAFNFMVFAGAFALQWGTGLVVDASRAAGYARPVAFAHAFWLVWALQAASLAAFVLWRARAHPALAPSETTSG